MADDSSYRPASSALLSESYRQLNSELHRRDPHYGTTGRRYVEAVRNLALRHSARTILDYGCGKRDLWKALAREFDVRNFDPAIPEFAVPPEPADLVACIDVLEHVEPEFLEHVLRDLSRVTTKVAFFTIATRPSGKQLADGTNCHRIVKPLDWWQERLERHFEIGQLHSARDNNGMQATIFPNAKPPER